MSRFWNQLQGGLLALNAMIELDKLAAGQVMENKSLRQVVEIVRQDLPADDVEATCFNMPAGSTLFHAHWMEERDGRPLKGMTHNDVRSRILELAGNLEAVATGDPSGDWQLAKDYFLRLHQAALARSAYRRRLAA